MICNRRSIAAAAGLLVFMLLGAATNASAQGAAVQAAQESTVQPSAAPGASSQPAVGVGQMRRDLTPWSMFTSADIVVQAVMVGLAIASVATWTVWFAKSLELMFARRKLRRSLTVMMGARSLPEAAARVGNGRGIMQAFIDAAGIELHLSSDVVDRQGIKERIATRLARLEAAAARDMSRGTGVLATIGATAPFVGLFGTVWGIMNSFVGISKAQTTNLAVVAPGIAEALLATAMGLFAAIPAVIIYNHFARAIAGYRARVGDASAETLRLVSRDLDKGYGRGIARAAE
jgi:biopolymer transport protein ExbB